MPRKNLSGSSCRMNAAKLLFLRVWEALFGEEQHSSGNGNQTAAPRFLMIRIPKACAPSASGKEDRTADSRKYPVTYCVTECAAV